MVYSPNIFVATLRDFCSLTTSEADPRGRLLLSLGRGTFFAQRRADIANLYPNLVLL